MELISKTDANLNIALIAKNKAKSDAQKALMGRVLFMMDNMPTIEAIPKADYEARLKADMVAMLEDVKKEMNPIKECEYQIYGKEHWNFVGKCQDVVQQKINALKESKDANMCRM